MFVRTGGSIGEVMKTARCSVGLFGFCVIAAAVPITLHAADKPILAVRAASARPTLAGVVVGPNGKPVAGANVYLYTAAPLKGTSPFCPSCYPDCQKQAVTNPKGQFRIPALDPNLRFRVLVVADGFAPTFTSRIVPANGAVRLVLPPPRPAAAEIRRVFRGMVVGPGGAAVVGAKIEPNGISADGRVSVGGVDGVDRVGVTNKKGEFDLLCDSPNSQVAVLISARGLASQTTPLLPTGSVRHSFTMETGATVRGRVQNLSGAPLGPVAVGIVQADKEVETFVGHTDIGTDKNGQFMLTNITPNQDYVLYGTMDTFGAAGSKPVFLPLQKIHVGASGSTTDLGTLSVRPARHLSGRVVLPGNKPVPLQTRLLVSRDAAWDSSLLILDKSGAFQAKGLPDETVGLFVRIPGYHIAPASKGYDKNRQSVFVSVEKSNVDGLQIFMEPDKR